MGRRPQVGIVLLLATFPSIFQWILYSSNIVDLPNNKIHDENVL